MVKQHILQAALFASLGAVVLAKDDYKDDYKYAPTAAPTPAPEHPRFYYINFLIDPRLPFTPEGQVAREITAEFGGGQVVPFAAGDSKLIASCSHKTCYGFGDAIVKGETVTSPKDGSKHDVLKVEVASYQPVLIDESGLQGFTTADELSQTADDIPKPTPPGAEIGIICPCATQVPTVDHVDCQCNNNHGVCQFLFNRAGSAVIATPVAKTTILTEQTSITDGCDEQGFHGHFRVTCSEKTKKTHY